MVLCQRVQGRMDGRSVCEGERTPMRSRRSRRWRGMMVTSWDSQRKATSEGVRGPVPERGAGVAIGRVWLCCAGGWV